MKIKELIDFGALSMIYATCFNDREAGDQLSNPMTC
jgi:hypothetical protein